MENINETQLTLEERWERLTLARDFMFCRIMHNERLCTEMIRRILPDMDIGHIEYTQYQKESKHSLDTRGVRFDVYARSDNRKIFDCEVQTTDKKDLPRRTRAYHIAMGLDALEKKSLKHSGKYDDLPDVFVIFICTFDPFHRGRHIYTFHNTCCEDSSVMFDDGALTVFLNAMGKADDVSQELKAFLDFMVGKTSDDPFIMELADELWKAKQDSEFRRNNMLLISREDEARAEGREEGKAEGRAEGLEEGISIGEAREKIRSEEHRKQERLTYFDRMIAHGINYDEASEILGLA